MCVCVYVCSVRVRVEEAGAPASTIVNRTALAVIGKSHIYDGLTYSYLTRVIHVSLWLSAPLWSTHIGERDARERARTRDRITCLRALCW